MLRRLFGYCFALAFLGAPAVRGENIPPWLQQIATASAPAFGKNVPAVVLLDESRSAIDEDGHVTPTKYYAVRILSPEGRGAAVAREIYLTNSGKVREIRAWLIRPSGEVKRYGKDQTLDVAAVNDDVYNEVRAKVIAAGDDAEVGAIFGYEVTSEDRSIFTQFEWQFQEICRLSCRRVAMPSQKAGGQRVLPSTMPRLNRLSPGPLIRGNCEVFHLSRRSQLVRRSQTLSPDSP